MFARKILKLGRFFQTRSCSSDRSVYQETLELVAQMVKADMENKKYSCGFKVFKTKSVNAEFTAFRKAHVDFATADSEIDNRIAAFELFARTAKSLCDENVNGDFGRAAMDCLLRYRDKADQHLESLLKFDPKAETESELHKLLCTHLFQPLVPEKVPCVVNKAKDKNHLEKPLVCPCGCGTAIDHFSFEIGNPRVWHGQPNMLIGNTSVVIRPELSYLPDYDLKVVKEELTDRELSNKDKAKMDKVAKERAKQRGSVSEMKEEFNVDHNGRITTEQMLGQVVMTTITNAFLATMRHGLKSTLVPTVLASDETIKILMYDCENDILLETKQELDLFVSHERRDLDYEQNYEYAVKDSRVNMNTITFLWLCLNYINFGPYIPSTRQQDHICQSKFLECISPEAKRIYEDELQVKIGRFTKSDMEKVDTFHPPDFEMFSDKHTISLTEFKERFLANSSL